VTASSDAGSTERPSAPTPIESLVGIYHANGTLWGEVSYWVGARLGRAHCALCDITHGTFRRKRDWDDCAASLPVPFTTCHLDDRPADLVEITDGVTPCVVARTSVGPVILVDAATLEGCDGDPTALASAIEAALRPLAGTAGGVDTGPTYTSGRDSAAIETTEDPS
jgi:hypothetical protein